MMLWQRGKTYLQLTIKFAIMRFGNNMESMGFEKSGWSVVETSSDGNTIYMGKPGTPEAAEDEPVWMIKRVLISTSPDGSQTFITEYSQPRVRWSERHSLTYKFF